MPNGTRLDHQPWKPGYLGAKVAVHAPHGISQKLAMAAIAKALAGGQTNPVLETIESTISITDDAIYHLMRKR